MDSYICAQMSQYDLQKMQEGFANLFPGYDIDMNELFLMIMQGKAGSAVRMFF